MQIYIEILIVVLLFVLILERFYSNRNKTQKSEQKEEKKKVKEQKSSSIMGETKHIPKVKKTVQNPNPIEEKQEQPPKKSVVPTEELDEVFSSSNDNVNPEEWKVAEEEELQALRSFNNDDDFATGLSFEELQKIPEMMNDDKVTRENITLAVKLSGTELLESLNEQMPQAQKRVSDLIDSYLNSPQSKNDNWESFDIREFV